MVRRIANQYSWGSALIDTPRKFWLVILWSLFGETWLMMLFLGILAGYLAIPGLAIGYWATFGIGTLWGLAKGHPFNEHRSAVQ